MGSSLNVSTSTPQRDAVTRNVQRAIIVGALAPGEKLREVALAHEYGVSRATLREALNGLVQSGLLTHAPYRGYGVTLLDVATIRDLASTRVPLDLIAVKAIRGDLSGRRTERLNAAWNEISHRMLDDDPLVQFEAHIAFHHAIWETSGNRMLMRLWPVIESTMTIALAQDQAFNQDLLRSYRLHRLLVDVISTGNIDDIERALIAHTVDNAELMIAMVGSSAAVSD